MGQDTLTGAGGLREGQWNRASCCPRWAPDQTKPLPPYQQVAIRETPHWGGGRPTLDLPRLRYQQVATSVPPTLGTGPPHSSALHLHGGPTLSPSREDLGFSGTGLELEGPPRAWVFTTSPTNCPTWKGWPAPTNLTSPSRHPSPPFGGDHSSPCSPIDIPQHVKPKG